MIGGNKHHQDALSLAIDGVIQQPPKQNLCFQISPNDSHMVNPTFRLFQDCFRFPKLANNHFPRNNVQQNRHFSLATIFRFHPGCNVTINKNSAPSTNSSSLTSTKPAK